MEEKTKLKKTKEWFENKKIIVVLVILFIAYIAVAQLFKSTQDIKESVDQLRTTEVEQEAEPTRSEPAKNSIQLSGKVVDTNNQALRQAKIEIVGWNGIVEYTDEHGNFLIEQVHDPIPASAEIMITKEKYRTYVQKIDLAVAQQKNLGRMILETENIPSIKNTGYKTTSPPPTARKDGASSDKVVFEKNTFNGAVITNPSGPININTQTKTDTTGNE